MIDFKIEIRLPDIHTLRLIGNVFQVPMGRMMDPDMIYIEVSEIRIQKKKKT